MAQNDNQIFKLRTDRWEYKSCITLYADRKLSFYNELNLQMDNVLSSDVSLLEINASFYSAKNMTHHSMQPNKKGLSGYSPPVIGQTADVNREQLI